MVKLRARLAVALVLAAPGAAMAQAPLNGSPGTPAPPMVDQGITINLGMGGNQARLPTFLPAWYNGALGWTYDSLTTPMRVQVTNFPACSSRGGGGATPTTVNQGVGESQTGTGALAWWITDPKLEALISGNGLNVNVTFPGSQAVTGAFFQSTQPVSLAAVPLPAGAATSANQPGLASDNGALAHVTNFPSIQPISVTALPLPAGAATSSNQPAVATAGTSTTTGLGVQGMTNGVPVGVSVSSLPLPAGAATSANQPVLNADGGAAAHITNFPSTQPITASALPLPSGAATASGQTPLTAPGTSATQAAAVQGVSGGVPVAVSESSAPPGVSTAGNQTTQITAEQATAANTNGVSTAANQTAQLTAMANRVSLTQTQVSLAAGTSTSLLPANAARKSLRIGAAPSVAFYLGYSVAASTTSSVPFGYQGTLAVEQYGPGDGVPTGAINGYCAAACTLQVGEGN